MTVPRKPDSQEIITHLQTLKDRLGLGQAQSWWPRYLFRFVNIDAAAMILNEGKVLSREAATSRGVIVTDCASPEIIASTADKWKQYVRLYFRPRTPMQYDIEGFRTPDKFKYRAHCPVPVLMLFDSANILTRQGTEFSNGNLASANADVGGDADFLKRIPFDYVYHEGAFPPQNRKIIFHRHAEVIVPNELDLSPLKFIGCRSRAEYETLLNLLEPSVRKNWRKKIGLGAKGNLHYRLWTFIEEVQLNRTKIHIKFNPSSYTSGPFHIRMDVFEEATGKKYFWEKQNYTANSTEEISLTPLENSEKYTVTIKLNTQLAYSNCFEEIDIPF